ncbi:hypothetical protein CMI47_04720 [Candidatus Pacearchaeota archaeon]|jgi:hypothetical protein|nr:hypothetical protein [Candidatus Pacearchaeota archaeon]|tara:strand:+ start:9405 stop:9662 length:258 start_codon:yes stop_codon:yes gene_type:complete
MKIIKAYGRTELGSSSGARDDAGGSSGSPRDTKSLPANMFSDVEPETEGSRKKKKNKRFNKKRIYQLGISVPAIDDEDIVPRSSS